MTPLMSPRKRQQEVPLPVAPHLTRGRVVKIHNQAEADAAGGEPGTHIVVAESNSIEHLELRTSDLLVTGETSKTTIGGHVRVYERVERVGISGLVMQQLKCEGPLSFSMLDCKVDCPNAYGGQPVELRGDRIQLKSCIVIGRSTCGGVWSAGGLYNVSIEDCSIQSVSGYQSTFRLHGAKNGQLIRCTLTNPNKHNLRLHDGCEDWLVSRCILKRGGIAVNGTDAQPNERIVIRGCNVNHQHNLEGTPDDLLKAEHIHGFKVFNNILESWLFNSINWSPAGTTDFVHYSNLLNSKAID